MTETPSQKDGADLKVTPEPRKDWWRRAEVIALVVAAVAGAVVATVAVLTLGPPLSKDGLEAGRSASVDPPAVLPKESAAQEVTGEEVSSNPDAQKTMEVEPLPLTPGCAAEDTFTSCEAEHDSEVAAIQPCTADGLVKFMGGTTQLEVLRDVLSVEPREDLCLIRGIDSSTKQSLAHILRIPAGDTYRRCWAIETDTEVGCDVPHFAEQIYAGGSEGVDCEQRFADYVDKDFGAFANYLEIEARPGSTSACWVKMRVSNQLTASIRNLKDRPLPLQDP